MNQELSPTGKLANLGRAGLLPIAPAQVNGPLQSPAVIKSQFDFVRATIRAIARNINKTNHPRLDKGGTYCWGGAGTYCGGGTGAYCGCAGTYCGCGAYCCCAAKAGCIIDANP